MTGGAVDPPLIIKGWLIFAHPQFLDSFESLIVQVERLRTKHPKGYTAKNSTKRLAAIVNLAFEIIPQKVCQWIVDDDCYFLSGLCFASQSSCARLLTSSRLS